MGFNSTFKGLIKVVFSLRIFAKYSDYQVLWKCVQWGAELFHTYVRTYVRTDGQRGTHTHTHTWM